MFRNIPKFIPLPPPNHTHYTTVGLRRKWSYPEVVLGFCGKLVASTGGNTRGVSSTERKEPGVWKKSCRHPWILLWFQRLLQTLMGLKNFFKLLGG